MILYDGDKGQASRFHAQNLLAHLPAPQKIYSQASSIDTHLIADDSIAQEANVCVA